MNTLSIILFGLFVAIAAFLIGLHRGNENRKYDYDEGYTAGYYDCQEKFEVEDPDRTRYDKARELLRQLDDLFEEDNKIDCGEY